MSLLSSLSPSRNLEGAVQNYINYAIRDAAELVIEKEVDEYRRIIAKKVWKAIDKFMVETVTHLSPHDIKTHVHFIFKEKEK
jgi:hypothetical protein